MKKKYLKNAFDFFLAFLVFAALFQFINNNRQTGKLEGMAIDHVQLLATTGEIVPLTKAYTPPYGILFWHSRCAPCLVELSRVQSAIEDGSLLPKNVLTLNVGDDPVSLQKFMKKKGYTFPVYYQHHTLNSKRLPITATPTVFHVKAGHTIAYASSGVGLFTISNLKKFISE